MLTGTPFLYGLVAIAFALFALRLMLAVRRAVPETGSIGAWYSVSEATAPVGSASESSSSTRELSSTRLPWRYCALMIVVASLFCYAGIYLAIRAVLGVF